MIEFILPSIIILIINHFGLKKRKWHFLFLIPLCLFDIFIYIVYVIIFEDSIRETDDTIYMGLPFAIPFICAFLATISVIFSSIRNR